jgi:hypothetical protein
MNQLEDDRSGDGGLLLSKNHSICLKNKKKYTKNVKYVMPIMPLITLETGSTLASGGLGTTGVKPTY